MNLTCREFIAFLMDYVSGDLPPDQREVFVEHLAVCLSCVNYMNTYLQAVEMGKESFSDDDEDLPEEVPQALVQAILEAKRGADEL